MKAITTVTLMATTMLLTFADSETPKISSEVTATMPSRAGRLTTPMTFSPVSGSTTSTPGAAVSAAGMLMPRSCIRLTV